MELFKEAKIGKNVVEKRFKEKPTLQYPYM